MLIHAADEVANAAHELPDSIKQKDHSERSSQEGVCRFPMLHTYEPPAQSVCEFRNTERECGWSGCLLIKIHGSESDREVDDYENSTRMSMSMGALLPLDGQRLPMAVYWKAPESPALPC
jgi:hypothetical protein